MSKRQTTLAKFQNRKPDPTKTQGVVPCNKYGSIRRIEKLQNQDTRELYISHLLAEKNRNFLEDRCSEGTLDDLVSLIRVAWNSYSIGQLISIVEQSPLLQRELNEEDLP
jgi:hypothetical protein